MGGYKKPEVVTGSGFLTRNLLIVIAFDVIYRISNPNTVRNSLPLDGAEMMTGSDESAGIFLDSFKFA